MRERLARRFRNPPSRCPDGMPRDRAVAGWRTCQRDMSPALDVGDSNPLPIAHPVPARSEAADPGHLDLAPWADPVSVDVFDSDIGAVLSWPERKLSAAMVSAPPVVRDQQAVPVVTVVDVAACRPEAIPVGGGKGRHFRRSALSSGSAPSMGLRCRWPAPAPWTRSLPEERRSRRSRVGLLCSRSPPRRVAVGPDATGSTRSQFPAGFRPIRFAVLVPPSFVGFGVSRSSATSRPPSRYMSTVQTLFRVGGWILNNNW